ncbi:MAG: hypothetical protein MOB07_17890 [Acidobacteria bacterium]|nr:hypothetical protein [Acidobacteriota bacterium]
MPGEISGSLFNHTHTDLDGTMIFTTTATTSQLGDVVRKLTDGSFEYRYLRGGALRFDATRRLVAMVDRNNLPLFTIGPCGCFEAARQFDSRGIVTVITDRLGNSETYEYEPIFNKLTRMDDELITLTSPSGRITRYSYDARDQLALITDPMGDTILFSYDNRKNLTALTDERGNTTTFIFHRVEL